MVLKGEDKLNKKGSLEKYISKEEGDRNSGNSLIFLWKS